MRIKQITHQHRRDFSALMECEHCDHTYEKTGMYDDDNYHRNVIPKIPCPKCGKTASDDYRALSTKYPAEMIV